MSKEISTADIENLILKNSTGNKDPITKGVDLFDSGYLDSFSVMKLVQELETQFDIVFDYNDLRREYFKNSETILALLVKRYGIKGK